MLKNKKTRKEQLAFELGVKMRAGSKPEVKYRARCAGCDAWLPLMRGFTDKREYDYKKDGYLCEACDAKPKPPPPPSQKEVILANLDAVEAARKAGEITTEETLVVMSENLKALISGNSIEQFVRKKQRDAEGKGWVDGEFKNEPKGEEPAPDEHRDVIKGSGPADAAPTTDGEAKP
jgi:hypothetical protein